MYCTSRRRNLQEEEECEELGSDGCEEEADEVFEALDEFEEDVLSCGCCEENYCTDCECWEC